MKKEAFSNQQSAISRKLLTADTLRLTAPSTHSRRSRGSGNPDRAICARPILDPRFLEDDNR